MQYSYTMRIDVRSVLGDHVGDEGARGSDGSSEREASSVEAIACDGGRVERISWSRVSRRRCK